jgi:hypothetical protein
MRSARKGDARTLILLGLTASIAVHIAVLTFLALGMDRLAPGVESAIIEVSLSPRSVTKLRPRKAMPRPPAQDRQTPAHSPATSDLPNGRAPSIDARTAPSPPSDLTDAVRRALRSSVGCDSPDAARLSPEEREACRKRLSALGRGAPVYAVEPADPIKAAAFDRAAAANARNHRYMQGPQPNPPCVAVWCPPCKGASCPEPVSSTFAR